jgi:RecA/RadA recombinase
LLHGGLYSGQLTIAYGKPRTGKTSLAISCASECASNEKKVLYIDSDYAFHPNRLAQMTGEQFEKISKQIIIIRPRTFHDQSLLVEKLDQYTNDDFGLVIIDTVTSLYLVELSTLGEAFSLNRELNRQLAFLIHWAKTLDFSVLVTSQVRSSVEVNNAVIPVATRVVKYWATNILRLEASRKDMFRAVIEKDSDAHISGLFTSYKISEKGIIDVDDR